MRPGRPNPCLAKPGRPEPLVPLPSPVGESVPDAPASIFKAMPDHSGAAFVLVQHLDPNYESALAKIIGQSAGLAGRTGV